jgi:hypothetical protein
MKICRLIDCIRKMTTAAREMADVPPSMRVSLAAAMKLLSSDAKKAFPITGFR